MTMQKTIQVRRVNNSLAGMSKHITLTNVRNTEDSMFAFGMTDDGDEIYIPAAIVRLAQMTEADIGAGFTCPVKSNPRAVGETETAPWVAINPVTWDGEAETITVDVEEDEGFLPVTAPVENQHKDWDRLVGASEQVIELIGPLDDTFQKIGTIIKGLQYVQTQIGAHRDGVKKFQKVLDEVAPELEE